MIIVMRQRHYIEDYLSAGGCMTYLVRAVNPGRGQRKAMLGGRARDLVERRREFVGVTVFVGDASMLAGGDGADDRRSDPAGRFCPRRGTSSDACDVLTRAYKEALA